MAHLSNFGVGNFRAFKDLYNFDFAPITVLTGTNSSGKSSLTKAILLIKESFSDIRISYKDEFLRIASFDLTSISSLSFAQQLQLGNFEVSKNHRAIDEYIYFNLPFKLPDCIDDFILNLKYRSDNSSRKFGQLHSFKLIHKETNDIVIQVSETLLGQGSKTNTKIETKVDLKKLWVILQRNGSLLKQLNETNELIREEFDDLGIQFNWNDDLEVQYDFPKSLNDLIIKRNAIIQEFPWLRKMDTIPNESFTDGPLYYKNIDDHILLGENRIFRDSTIHNYLFIYDVNSHDSLKRIYPNLSEGEADELMVDYVEARNYINENALPGESIVETIRRWELEEIENYINQEQYDPTFNPVNLFDFLLNRIDAYSIYNFINPSWYAHFNKGKRPVVNEHLQKLRENKRLVLYGSKELGKNCPDLSIGNYFMEGFLYEGILSMAQALKKSLGVDFIPSIRNRVDRIYRNTTQDSFFHEVLYKLMGVRLSKKAEAFLSNYVRYFGIAEELKIETSRDSSFSTITLISDGQEIHLADVGYGYSQIIPIILKLTLIIQEREVNKRPDVIIMNKPNHDFFATLVVIEEPETNLHPALQSKLADMFIECYKNYNIQFIIETHSEYLIRRLQRRTAEFYNERLKNDLSIPTDFTQLYYFYPPDNVPEGEKQVYPINIEKDGALTKNFGTGFFDEAGNEDLLLYQIAKHNKN